MTLTLHGKNLIGLGVSGEGEARLRAVNPADGEDLAPAFFQATLSEIDRALHLADEAFEEFRDRSPQDIAHLLEAIAEQILALGDQLLERCHAETALNMQRLTMERGRTVSQARLFAQVVREGSWVEARIDRAEPQRRPLPKPNVRRMLIPVGPVVVFGAGNFPLAISVAGTDTISALAAGCPVVVKAHESHPGTSELVGRAILNAAREAGMPNGVFSLLHGRGREIGAALVRHPLAGAVGFTGSPRAGRALFDAAASRPEPIPVFAEMGSVNPVFLLPSALAETAEEIAEGFLQSMTLGVGQFCTQPGVAVGLKGAGLNSFLEKMVRRVEESPPGTLLNAGICRNYAAGIGRLAGVPGVRLAARSRAEPDLDRTQAATMIFATDARTFLSHQELGEEVFGPCSIVVECEGMEDLEQLARSLGGHLTATVHGTAADLTAHARLIRILERRVGRLIFNGFPTGVEVCPAMHHGGPYPATTDSRFTSIGTAAILRFVRPICYQDFPDEALPEPLRNRNSRGIWRLLDGSWTQDDG